MTAYNYGCKRSADDDICGACSRNKRMCIRNMNKEGLNPREQASSKRDRIEALACMGGAEAGNIRLSPTTSSKIQDPF